MINGVIYRKWMVQYIRDAIANTDGSNARIGEYLSGIIIKGWFVKNKEEKLRAVGDARAAFDEHRHWPLDLVLSHLGIRMDEVK